MRCVRRRRGGRSERGEDAGDIFRKLGIRRHGDEVLLPQVEIPLGQACKVRRFRHGAEYIGGARARPAAQDHVPLR
jgi:hypothetical protein